MAASILVVTEDILRKRWFILVTLFALTSIPAAASGTVQSLVDELEASFIECNADYLISKLDRDAMAKAIIAKLSDDMAAGREAVDGFAGKLGEALCDGSEFTLLSLKDKGTSQHATFRMLRDDGVNYIVFKVAYGRGKPPAIEDFFLALTGEWITETIRNALIPVFVQQDQSLLERLLSTETRYVKSLPKFAEITETYRDSPQKALNDFKSLPREMRSSRMGITMHMQIAQVVSDAAYAQALSEIDAFTGDDPSLSLLLADHYFLSEQWDKLNLALDRLDKQFGPDPYLNVLRANGAFSRNDYESADALTRVVIEAEPTMIQGWETLLGLALQTDNHETTLEALIGFIDLFEIAFGDLSDDPDFEAFMQTPQYTSWQERRADGTD